MKLTGRHIQGMKGARRSFKRQKKIFAKLGLPNVDNFFDGTINIDTSPLEYKIISFDYLFQDVEHKSFPRKRIEDFGFIVIEELVHDDINYKDWGYLYFPHKSPHFEKQYVFEIVGPKLENIKNNAKFELKIKDGRLIKIK